MQSVIGPFGVSPSGNGISARKQDSIRGNEVYFRFPISVKLNSKPHTNFLMVSEQWPLITGVSDNGTLAYAAEFTPQEDSEASISSEVSALARSSGPLVLSFVLQYSMSMISIYATGKLGPLDLAAASLSLCTFNITGLAFYQGMATSLDSFCSQAYGARRYELVGVYFQRCSLMCLALTAFLLTPIWYFSGSILALMVSDAELILKTQSFLRVMIWGSPALLLFETGKKFLLAQNIFNAGTYVLIFGVPVSFIFNWLLVWHPVYGLGFIGAPVATCLSYWSVCIFMFIYVYFIEGKKCWGGLDLLLACKNWSQMLTLAIPGVVMVQAEFIAFEILTIRSAAFGVPSLAAQSIAANLGAMAFQLPFAISVAVLTRIGNYVGMRDLRKAHLVTRASFLMAFFISFFNFSWVFFGKKVLVRFFSDDEEVDRIGEMVATLVAINQIFDALNVMEAGVLRGQGRQKIGLYLTLACYYIVALPFGFYISRLLKLRGLWMGLIAGVSLLAFSEFIFIYLSDWDRILEESDARHDH